MLKIFNTLTKNKEIFIPICYNKINIYVCGITSYQYCHLGHARIFIIFDLIIKYLKFLGYKVNYIRNITDIDDKIINYLINEKLKFKSLNLKQYTSKIIFFMNKDLKKLHLLNVNYEPKVTFYINHIKNIIKKLLKLKYAYINKKGDVMFNIKKYINYGKLSNNKISNINNSDNFVLWKINKYYSSFIKKLNINWNSPWGKGRPGWHIECSSITDILLGNYYDIHGGGQDLIFPHHENEIAQNEALYGKPHVKYWIHVGLVIMNKQKMSKSLNNYLTIKDLLSKYSYEEIKLAFLTTHYRKNYIFSYDNFDKAKIALYRMYLSIKKNNINNINININFYYIIDIKKKIKKYEYKFYEALNDDFNTPKACAILFKITNFINKYKLIYENNNFINLIIKKLIYLANILGLLTINPNKIIKKNINITPIINLIIKLRNKARNNKNWYLADKLRIKIFYKLGSKIFDDKIKI